MSLDAFIDLLAAPIAQEHRCSLDEARRWVKLHLIAEAYDKYRALGAPLGDTDAGFMAWLMPRRQPPTG